MKCNTCEYKIKDKNFMYCPICGTKIGGGKEYVGPHLDRISYLWEREEGGKFLHSNFRSMRDMSVISFKKSKPIRQQLGDFSHINLLNLQTFSFLYLNPSYTPELYKIAKLLGHYSTENMKVIGIDKLVNALSRTGLFWRVFQNEMVRKTHEQGWRNVKIAMVELERVDKKNKSLTYKITESHTSRIKSPKHCCFMPTGALSGQAESFYSGFWDAVETKCVCAGYPYCEIKLSFHKNEREPNIPSFTKENFNSILNQLVEDVIKRDVAHRKVLGDFSHLFAHQAVNYLLTTVSSGHTVLGKHSGVLCGERIAKEANLDGDLSAFDYARNLFLYFKAGILHEPQAKENKIIFRMDESVYSSGVNNIGIKLDVFLTGIIEGLLNQSTGEKWFVEETKCLANGDEHCEFACRRQKTR